MFKLLVFACLISHASAKGNRRAHHFVYSHDPDVLEMITKHKRGVQSISLGCKCHASSWEEKAKGNPNATWCEQIDECREFIPHLKQLGIQIYLNVNLGTNKYAGTFLKDAQLFSEALKTLVAEFGTHGFSFDLEAGGTGQRGDDYASFLEIVSKNLGNDQELMITGGHHTTMTHNITALVAHANWFSMDTYSFKTKDKWQKLVSSQFTEASACLQDDRYIPGVSAGAESANTHWDIDTFSWALASLDSIGISRVGVFGVAVPDLPENKTFYWDVVEAWVTGSAEAVVV